MRALKYIKNPLLIIPRLGRCGRLKWMSDEKYLCVVYRALLGKKLHLDNPRSFNEKLQWLKLYDRKPHYTKMVDKYAAKQYIGEIIGNEYLVPTYGVWNSFDEIDFDTLPNDFVLKCTHDSGGLVIIKDKSKMNIEKTKGIINRALKKNFYYLWREWPYKDVKPRIIAEKCLCEGLTADGRMIDYKFYCFNGEPQFLYVSQGMDNHSTARISFMTLEWKQMPFWRKDYKSFDFPPAKPQQLQKMIEISRAISRKATFLRVDLYEIEGKVYFSEATFFPCAGFMEFSDTKYDYEIGEMLRIKSK